MLCPVSEEFTRPNEDVEVTAMCVVEKSEQDSSSSQSARSEAGKRDSRSKVKRRPIQPSVICGVSLRCPRLQSNCDESKKDLQSDVQLMNKVNESISGEVSPHIITDAEIPNIPSESDLLNSRTNFLPYLLVVAVKEDVNRVSKQPSMDSLKPSMSSSNIIPNLASMSMSQPDWGLGLVDYHMDSDVHEETITKVPHAHKGGLSASSPTEGSSKLEELAGESGSSSSVAFPDSAIKRFSGPRAGSVLQCVAMPSNLQFENLEVSSICPTLDKQHLIVVLTPKKVCSVLLKPSAASSDTSEQSSEKSSELLSEMSSNDPSVLLTDSNSGSQESKSGGGVESSDFSDSAEDNKNTNTSCVGQLDAPSQSGCILIYRFNYDCDTHYASLDETPVVIHHVESSDLGVRTVCVLPADICEQVEEEEIMSCEDEIFIPAPSATCSLQSQELYGQLAVIYESGRMAILNIADLSVLASIGLSGGEQFVDVTYCSGIAMYF